MARKKGLFITFEGGEGSGKTTQIETLASRVKDCGLEPVLSREPGGTSTGRAIRKLLLDPASTHIGHGAELFLYAADRRQHVEEVLQPALDRGCVVICDRFVDSSIAYQGYGRGLDLEFIKDLMNLATGGLKPDITIVLDVDPNRGMSRVAGRNGEYGAGGDRFERAPIDFHSRVRQGYESLAEAEPERLKMINAGTMEEVSAAIWHELQPFLKPHLDENCR